MMQETVLNSKQNKNKKINKNKEYYIQHFICINCIKKIQIIKFYKIKEVIIDFI